LNHDLALDIQRFREYLAQLLEEGKSDEQIGTWVRSYLPIDEAALSAIVRYAREQYRYSVIPHARRILIEQFKDGNKKHVIVHGAWGRRVNDVLARAVAFVNARLTGRDVELSVTDNGFTLRSSQPIHTIRALRLLKPEDLDRLMELALERSEVLKRRFRHCAARSLMILRSYKGETKSVGRQQVSSQLILSVVKGLGRGFPILKETYREILEDLMDIANAKVIIARIQAGEIALVERATDLPSPFGFQLVLQGYSDLLKVEDRVEFVRRLHRMVLAQIAGEKQRVEDVLPHVEFTYERLWEEQGSMDRLKEADYQEFLREQLRVVSRKIALDADIAYHANRLIDGETTGYPEKFTTWVRTLLSGTIPKVWPDELVKFFQEHAASL
jgi:ATP-dependent Lhr-like helicase